MSSSSAMSAIPRTGCSAVKHVSIVRPAASEEENLPGCSGSSGFGIARGPVRGVRRGASGVVGQSAGPHYGGRGGGRPGCGRVCIDRVGGPPPLLRRAPARTRTPRRAKAMPNSWGSSAAP